LVSTRSLRHTAWLWNTNICNRGRGMRVRRLVGNKRIFQP